MRGASTARDPSTKQPGINQTLAVTAALLAAGADPNAGNQFGAIPLHTAAKYNRNLAVIAALLEAGADPNARDDNGKTPVDMAHKNKNPAVRAALKKAVSTAEQNLECAPEGGQDQAAVLTGCRALLILVLFRAQIILTRNGAYGCCRPRR